MINLVWKERLMRQMKHVALLATLVLSMSITVPSQSDRHFRIRLVDSETGFAISPNRVRIEVAPVATQGEKAGVIALPVPQEPHRLRIEAEGYRQFSGTFWPMPQAAPVEIRLRPETLPSEFESSHLEKLRGPNKYVAIGFVSD